MISPRSISSRLFCWLFSVGMLGLLTGGIALYFEVQNIIYDSMDHTLESELEIFTGLLHVEGGDLEFEYAETIHGDYIVPRSGHYFQVYIDGEVIAESISLAGEPLALSPDGFILENQDLQHKIYRGVGPAGETLRMMERSLVFAEHPARIIVAQSDFESEQMLRLFRNFLLVSGIPGIFVLAFLGQIISHRSLRPLKEFSDRIDKIGEKNIDIRLPTSHQYQEIGRLTLAFNSMLDRLKKSLQAREELLSDVSHELKTPVAVIRSHCDIYLQKERPSEEYIDALEVIRESSDVLGMKINRLLATAQTEAELLNAGSLESLDLATCLRQARTTVEPLAQDPQIDITENLEPDLKIRGNSERLVEAFASLLENAIKYNRPGGKVIIQSEHHNNQAFISIKDTGCGIDPRDLGKIFERFYRGQHKKLADGNGLGLGLVKTIIEAHEGQIEARNRQNGGSCFSITLPLI